MAGDEAWTPTDIDEATCGARVMMRHVRREWSRREEWVVGRLTGSPMERALCCGERSVLEVRECSF